MNSDFARLISSDVPSPFCVQIETTTRCNLRCIMCPKGTNGEVMGDLDVRVLDHVHGLLANAWEIRAHGFGETFLHHEFDAILQRCTVSRASVSIVTNGTLIDERRARLLIGAGVETIYTSIDAADPELFRTIRKTSLDKILANLRRLRALKHELGSRLPRVVLQMVGMSNNIHDLPALIRLAADVGGEEVHLVSFTEFDMETVRSFALRSLLACPELARPHLLAAQDTAAQLGIRLDIAQPYRTLVDGIANSATGGGVPAATLPAAVPAPTPSGRERVRAALRRALAGDLVGFASGALHAGRRSLGRATRRARPGAATATAPSPAAPAPRRAPRRTSSPRVRCEDPWNAVVINYKGEVNPCCMSQRVMGNVNETPFETVWDGEPYRAFREQLLSAEPPTECRNCAKAGWYDPYELEDWIEVGVNDAFGVQLGTGWGGVSDGVHWTRGDAILRLRNSGKRRLHVTLVAPPAPGDGDARGEVQVNGVCVGAFAFTGRDATSYDYDVPVSEADALVVRIITAHGAGGADGRRDVRQLGVGLRAASLVD